MDYTTIITALITSVFGGGIGVFLDRKNRDAEFTKKVQEIYTDFVEEAREKNNELVEENRKLVIRNKELEALVEKQSKEIRELLDVINSERKQK